MIRMIDTRTTAPMMMILSHDISKDYRQPFFMPEIQIEAPTLEPVITDGIKAIDFRLRGNIDITGIKATPRTIETLKPLDSKTEAAPECLTKLQYHDALGITPKPLGINPFLNDVNVTPSQMFIVARFFDYFISLLNEAKDDTEPTPINSEYYPHPAQLHFIEKPTPPAAPKPTNADMNASAGVRQCSVFIILRGRNN